MAARCFAIIEVLSTLWVPWILEQPSSSLMEEHPLFKKLYKTVTIYKATWWPVQFCVWTVLFVWEGKPITEQLPALSSNLRCIFGWAVMEA